MLAPPQVKTGQNQMLSPPKKQLFQSNRMGTDFAVSTEENEMIVECLQRLPSKALRDRVKTTDQATYMLAQHVQTRYAALCLDALHTYKNDPIRPLLEASVISKHTYNRAWLIAHFYCALWQLIQSSFSFIQPELKRLGFGYMCISAIEIFDFFARHLVDDDCAACLAKYCEVSSRKTVKEYRKAKKLLLGKGTVIQQRQQPMKIGKNELGTVVLVIFTICYTKAVSEPVLKGRLEALMGAAMNVGDYLTKSTYHAPSHAWKNGILGKGDKSGVYKFS